MLLRSRLTLFFMICASVDLRREIQGVTLSLSLNASSKVATDKKTHPVLPDFSFNLLARKLLRNAMKIVTITLKFFIICASVGCMEIEYRMSLLRILGAPSVLQ